MSELSQEARELIARARVAERTDAYAKRRVRAALAAHLGPVPPAVPPAASAAGAVGVGLSASKLMLICSLTVAGVVGTTAVIKTRHAPGLSAVPRPIERPVPAAVSRPALLETVTAAPVLAPAAPVTINDGVRPSPPEPVRKLSLRAPTARVVPPEPLPKPAVAPSVGSGHAAATAAPERVVAPVAPERAAVPVVPEHAVAPVAPLPAPVAVGPTLQPAFGSPSAIETPPSSWRSSNFPQPVPNREVARITLAAKPSKECTSERELKLLSGAQAALRAGNGQRALDQLEQHAATCPSATFWQERSAARVLALCLLHREPQALAEAAQLASLAPRSPLLARLRTSCAAAAVKP